MNPIACRALGSGITCIDAGYVQPGLACFYLVEEGGECAVIETGTRHSLPALLQLLARKNIDPEQVRYVIPTHVHLDHAGGAGAMMQVFPHARLLIHPRGARHMSDPERLIAGAMEVYGEAAFDRLYGEVTPVDAGRIREMGDGETVALGGRLLEFRHTTGHARHHFCVWDAKSRGWFSGDMFGVSYPWFRFGTGDFLLPSTTPTQFEPQEYLASLQLLAGYEPERIYLTHYGELAYSKGKAELLAQQVETYCSLAMTNAELDDLQGALEDYGARLLRPFAGDMPESELRSLLRFDMPLNAQGLTVWRQRQAAP